MRQALVVLLSVCATEAWGPSTRWLLGTGSGGRNYQVILASTPSESGGSERKITSSRSQSLNGTEPLRQPTQFQPQRRTGKQRWQQGGELEWKRAVTWLDANRPTATAYDWNGVIFQCCRAGRVEVAEQLVCEMQEALAAPPPTQKTYSPLFFRYAASGNWAAAAGLLEDLERRSDHLGLPSTVVFTKVLKACIVGGRTDVALEIFDRLRGYSNSRTPGQSDHGVWTETDTSFQGSSADEGLYQKQQQQEEEAGKGGEEVWQRQQRPQGPEPEADEQPSLDVIAYNTMLKAVVRSGDVDKALELFGRMSDDGVFADKVTFTTLMAGCKRLGEDHVMIQLFDAMRDTGVVPDSYIFGLVLGALGRVGDARTARRVHQVDMVQAGVPWNEITFAVVIDACAKAGDWREALALLDMMEEPGTGVDATVRAYTAAISACRIDGEWRVAKQLLRRMHTKAKRGQPNLAPNVLSLTAAVSTCIVSKELDWAIEVFRDMPTKYELQPNRYTYNCLLKVCAEAKDLETALVFYHDMVGHSITASGPGPPSAAVAGLPSPASASPLSERALDPTLVDDCEVDPVSPTAVSPSALSCGTSGRQMRPNGYTFSALLTACQRTANASAALAFLHDMLDRRIAPIEMHITSAMSACRRGQRPDAAVDILEILEHGDLGLRLTSAAAVIALKTLVQSNNDPRLVQRAYEIITQSRSLRLTSLPYNLLVEALARAGCLDLANAAIQVTSFVC